MRDSVRWVVAVLLVSLTMPGATVAQEAGFRETFDDLSLPGWEHSPNAVVSKGWLHIQPDGFAFRGGRWDDLTLDFTVRPSRRAAAVIRYRATDQAAYTLSVSANSMRLTRDSAGSTAGLGGARLDLRSGRAVHVHVSARGDRHEIALDGDVRITATDPRPLPPGGLFLSAQRGVARFDVVSLTPGGVPGPGRSPGAPPSTAPSRPGRSPGASVTPAARRAYEVDAWVPLGGPPGDLGYDIRYDFDDHDRWYVTDGQGGFFISTDRGRTWTASNQGIEPLEGSIIRPVFSATVDPHDTRTIWLGTQLTGHIYRSTDGGQSWERKDKGVTPHQGQHIRGFTVDPRSSDIVYAMAEVDCAILSSDCPPLTPGRLPPVGGRIYRSADGGKHWKIIWEGDALARYLWIDPGDSDVMYASTGIFDRPPMERSPDGLGVLKSTDGGRSWTVQGVANGLTNLHVGSLSMHPQDPATLLAGTGISGVKALDPETGMDVLVGGVFLTTDGGEQWTRVIANDTFGAVEFCAQDPRIAYAAGQLATYRSEDGGRTWLRFGDDLRETWGPMGVFPGVPIDLQTDPDDCSRVFLNNYIGGNFLSTDGAETWSIASSGYSGAQVYGVAVDPRDAAHVYATARMAPFVSHDGGTTWQGLSDEVVRTSISALTVDPSSADHLLGSQGGRYLVSDDGGGSWQAFEQFATPADVRDGEPYWMTFGAFAFAPSDPSIIYAGSRNDASADPGIVLKPEKHPGLGIFRSDDGGRSWRPANNARTAQEGVAAVLVHPTDPSIVYAASHWDGGVFKTTDGGTTWTRVNRGLPRPYERFYAMAMDPGSADTIILLGRAGVFKTVDGGGSWRQLTRGIDPGSTYGAIVYDPTDGRVVYLGSSRLGALYSTDGGGTFRPLTQGLDASLGALPVKSLAISADGSVLYAGTQGGGVWRLGTPTPGAGATAPAQ